MSDNLSVDPETITRRGRAADGQMAAGAYVLVSRVVALTGVLAGVCALCFVVAHSSERSHFHSEFGRLFAATIGGVAVVCSFVAARTSRADSRRSLFAVGVVGGLAAVEVTVVPVFYINAKEVLLSVGAAGFTAAAVVLVVWSIRHHRFVAGREQLVTAIVTLVAALVLTVGVASTWIIQLLGLDLGFGEINLAWRKSTVVGIVGIVALLAAPVLASFHRDRALAGGVLVGVALPPLLLGGGVLWMYTQHKSISGFPIGGDFAGGLWVMLAGAVTVMAIGGWHVTRSDP